MTSLSGSSTTRSTRSVGPKEPVPVEVKEKIIELQQKDVEAREQEKRFYEDWVRRDDARRAAAADKATDAEVVKAEKNRENSAEVKS